MNNYPKYSESQVQRGIDYSIQHNLSVAEGLKYIHKRDQQEQQAQHEKLAALTKLDTRKMTKKEITDATWQLPPLHGSLYDLLQEQGGFQTGSHIIANITNPNDEDWCVLINPNVFYDYTLGQSDNGYWEADGFTSLYAHFNNKLINILCFSDEALFDSWRFATEFMESTYDQYCTDFNVVELVNVKWKRVRLFRALRDIAYEPRVKKSMLIPEALKYRKCSSCSREAINFSCKDARLYWQETAICERCSGITY